VRLILIERRDHLEYLRDRFRPFARNLVVLYGGMTTGGRYLAEGFDAARLDTRFLIMPMSWRPPSPSMPGVCTVRIRAGTRFLSATTRTTRCRCRCV
jgi:hypothetical protein